MKKNLMTLVSLALASSVSATTVTSSPIEHLFVPEGFDSNDNVELMVSGSFPSDCYSRNKVETTVNDDVINVKITSMFNSERDCTSMKIPFMENVTVGSLQGGDYKINVNGKKMGEVNIAEARSQSVDEHIYAKIDYVELGFTGGVTGSAFLIGKNVSDCLEFDHVEYISNKNDTISVLPIMKKVSEDCNETRSFLQIPINYDLNRMNFNKTLLFVRTMDGKSVHGLVER